MRAMAAKKQNVVVDQCQKCEGIWLDQNEIYHFVDDKSKLLELERNGLNHGAASNWSCPRCQSALFSGTLPNFELQVESCPKCKGLWFDRGELHLLIKSSLRRISQGVSKPTHPASNIEKLPDFFTQVMDSNERIIWAEKPHLIMYLAGSFLILAFFMALVYIIFKDGPDLLHVVAELILMHPVVTLGLIAFTFAGPYLVYRNTIYALTNKRVVISSGVWGVDFKSIDYNRISDIQVTVNLLDKVFGTGSIQVHTPGQTFGPQHTGSPVYGNQFKAIADPYTVYRLIKELSVRFRSEENHL
jgi:Zn-finger nucleic acid-binding protein/membrane protein YdbS with pleckstrin-like domain